MEAAWRPRGRFPSPARDDLPGARSDDDWASFSRPPARSFDAGDHHDARLAKASIAVEPGGVSVCTAAIPVCTLALAPRRQEAGFPGLHMLMYEHAIGAPIAGLVGRRAPPASA